jgi:hypothetical protein
MSIAMRSTIPLVLPSRSSHQYYGKIRPSPTLHFSEFEPLLFVAALLCCRRCAQLSATEFWNRFGSEKGSAQPE